MLSTYDVVPYLSRPYARTHPARLAALAILYGMTPTPVASCKVLELGCGSGGNLIPMALEMPGSEFVGVDLSHKQIAAGREVIERLGLKNIELREQDLKRVGESSDELGGEFDYVIAHGVYGWVPADVRDAVMRIASRNLAKQGVAFVSYNTHPGGYLRRMFREMMLHHVAGVEDAEERIRKSRELVQFLDVSAEAVSDEVRATWRAEIADVLRKPPNMLFHDDLEIDWEPVFFHQFMAHARKHGLQFLAETDYDDMAESKLAPNIVEGLTALSGGDRVKREQYRDFVTCRKFRRTLLCHESVRVSDRVEKAKLRKLYVTTNAQAVTVSAEEEATGARTYQVEGLAKMKSSHPLVLGLMNRLMEAVPQRVHFEELTTELGPENAEALGEVLLSMYGMGIVELAAWRPDVVTQAGERPEASALARLQATRGEAMTTLTHNTVEPKDQLVCRLVSLLDGTRDRGMLKKDLCDASPESEREAVERELERNLAAVAKLGMLVG
jgi:SAM-dependent methyltransferase